jgi:malonyl-CoA O-methyltransferase
VARRLAEPLVVIRQAPARWLDWGAFLGAGAAPVAAVWPQARHQAVEPCAALRARHAPPPRPPWWARRTEPAPPVLAEDEVPAGAADMLWANLVLHTAADPAALLAQWHRALAVGGFVVFSTYGPDTLRLLRAVYAECGWPSPHPPYADMHDVGDALVQAGFAEPVMHQERLNLSWSGPEAALAELRALGGHLGTARFAGLRTPRWRGRLLQALARCADGEGRITLGFELVYGHAYKPAPRPLRGELAPVSLDALRSGLARRRPPG